MRKIVFCLGVLLVRPVLAATDTPSCSAKSGGTQAALLELYTSEGCSSCPPADQWLARYQKNGLYPDRVVPLALHVDYWNDLGWKDPYSQNAFTQRQHQIARRRQARTVYTPQFLINGKEMLRWRSQGESELHRQSILTPRADLSLRMNRVGDQMEISAGAKAKDPSRRADLFVVVTENNLTNHVQAGENSGQTLHHDFVARYFAGPISLKPDGSAQFSQKLKLDPSWKTADLGLVAFVQDPESGEVWQALARPPCR